MLSAGHGGIAKKLSKFRELARGGDMMAGVAAVQLVVQSRADGAELLDAVDQRANARPWDYADSKLGRQPAILGTKGVLKLAFELSNAGYRIIEVDVRDSSYEPLTPDLDEAVESMVKSEIKRGSEFDVPNTFILQNDLVLISITVRLPGTNHELTVNRDGLVKFRPDTSFGEVRSNLERALGYGHWED